MSEEKFNGVHGVDNTASVQEDLRILMSVPAKDSVDGPMVRFGVMESLSPHFRDYFIDLIEYQISVGELRMFSVPASDDLVRREWLEWEIEDYWGLHDEKWENGEILNVRVFITANELV